MTKKQPTESNQTGENILPDLLMYIDENHKEEISSTFYDLLENISLEHSDGYKEYSFEEAMNLAEKYIRNNYLRDALYYFEEALYIARKDDDELKQAFCLNKIGAILNNSGNFLDSKAFFDLVFKNKTLRLAFSCQSSSACCSFFNINITSYDAINILKNRPDLKPPDFITLENTYFDKYLSGEPFLFNNRDIKEKNIFFIKKRDDENCIFLENNLCSINDYKPLSCKRWPFEIDQNDRIVFHSMPKVLNFIESKCNYKLIRNNLDEESSKRFLRVSKNNINFDTYILQKIQKKIDYKNIVDQNKIFDLIFSESNYENNFINDISYKLKEINGIIKIKYTYFFNKKDEIKILFKVYTNDIANKTSKTIQNTLKSLNLFNVSYDIEQEKIFVSLKSDPEYSAFINVESLSNFEVIFHNEKILFEKEDFNFPKFKENFSIPLDQTLFEQIIISAKNIIKVSLKEKDLLQIQDVLNNLNSFVEKFSSNFTNSKMLQKLKRAVFDLTQLSLESKENSNPDLYKASLYKFNQVLDVEIRKNDTFLIDNMIKKLQVLNKLKLFHEEDKLLEIIIDLIPENDFVNERKLVKTISKLRRDYKNTNKKLLCLILLELFDYENEKLNLKRTGFYLDLFFEFYSPNLFKDDNVCSFSYIQQLLFEAGKIFIKLKNPEKAEKYFGILNPKLPEDLNKIADEYFEENFIDHAISYYEVSLKNSLEINSQLVLIEILIDLYIQNKDFGEIKKKLLLLNDIAEKNNLDDIRIFSSIKNSKIKYLSSEINDFEPLEIVRNYKSDEELFPLLFRYFRKSISENFSVLPVKFNKLKTKRLLIEQFPAKSYLINSNSKNIFDVFVLFKDVLLSFDEIKNFDYFENSKELSKSYLKLKLAEEFGNYKMAIKFAEKLIYLCLNNSEYKVLENFFKLYLGSLYEKSNNLEIAASKYQSILKENPEDKKAEMLLKATNFQLLLKLNEQKMNLLISSDMYVFLSRVIDNLKI